MNHSWKTAITSFLVFTLLATLCFACAEKEEEGKVTITIGEITDLTGPASPALLSVHYVTMDLVDYYNEEDLIPGVKLELVTYDCAYNPARDIPGYEWVRGRGAKIIFAPIYSTAEILKYFAEQDKVPVVTSSPTELILEPPGWVFALGATFADQMRTVLKWIGENHWDYTAEGRVPKVGYVGWQQAASVDIAQAMREYCQAHPDKFEWGSSCLPPVGTMSFIGEAEKLKGCDYIGVFAYTPGFFIRDFQAKGYDATFISEASAGAYKGFFVDLVGWEGVDGLLSSTTQGWVSDPYPKLDLAKEILGQNHPAEADDLIRAGTGYVCGFVTFSIFFEMIRNAVAEVGAENFDGQAFYDASLDFEVQYDGFPRWYFTETDRSCVHDVAIYEWSAAVEDQVRRSDWLPLVED
jgi:hypothetical protein